VRTKFSRNEKLLSEILTGQSPFVLTGLDQVGFLTDRLKPAN